MEIDALFVRFPNFRVMNEAAILAKNVISSLASVFAFFHIKSHSHPLVELSLLMK